MAYVAAILTILGLYLAGMVTSLFGPSQGRWLGIAGFIATVPIWAILQTRWRRGSLPSLIRRPAHRARRLLHISILRCALVCLAMLVTAFSAAGGAGGHDASRPVFDHQIEYRLNNGGEFTAVTRSRYLTVGSCFVIGWHALGTLFALLALHLALIGKLPPGFNQNRRSG